MVDRQSSSRGWWLRHVAGWRLRPRVASHPARPHLLPIPFVAVSFALLGVTGIVYNITRISLVQTITPERLLGRFLFSPLRKLREMPTEQEPDPTVPRPTTTPSIARLDA
jgi:hypothetical protein